MMKNEEHITPIAKLNLKHPRSSLRDYSDPYIPVKGSILIVARAGDNANNNNNNNNNNKVINHTQIEI